MRIKYDRESDVLTIEMSEDSIDHAEESANIITHVTEAGKPVLLEILDASEFLSLVSKLAARSKAAEFVDLSALG
jgi:uncharacterized protein YuzE